MSLNTLAGRSYNDLMQYPVFPWVLADFEAAQAPGCCDVQPSGSGAEVYSSTGVDPRAVT